MNVRPYMDVDIARLRSMPKQVSNPRAQWSEKPKAWPSHRQRNYRAVGRQDETTRFSVYQRQNLTDDNDFSCGIVYLPPGGAALTLARYNGPSHVHGDIAYRPHIHRATEDAIAAGRKPESDAEETDQYRTLEGALACLVDHFALSGIAAPPDAPGLFP